MSIIIREVDAPASEWVYLDNTTNYTNRQNKRLSSNPIESGGVVTDHTIKSNRKFSASGSISPWDFHLAGGTSRALSDGDSAVTTLGSVSVTNSISDYLPSSITQYLDSSSDVKVADIILGTPTKTKEAYLNDSLTKLQNLYDTDGLIDVYFTGYDGTNSEAVLVESVVITSLVLSEDLNTGDSIRVDLSFEKPTIAYVTTEDVPADLTAELATSTSKGSSSGTTLNAASTGTQATVYGTISGYVESFFTGLF